MLLRPIYRQNILLDSSHLSYRENKQEKSEHVVVYYPRNTGSVSLYTLTVYTPPLSIPLSLTGGLRQGRQWKAIQ